MPKRTRKQAEPFGNFDSVEQIGTGSFAEVFKARDKATNQSVALKVLTRTIREMGSNSTFDLETRALGTLSAHPNIVTLYRTEVLDDGRPMLVLELCEKSLNEIVQNEGPLHPQMVTRLGIQICGALETAHRSGILHRDIKPQNILISRYGVPQLADFGVAELKNSAGYESSTSGFSVLHAPPEVLIDQTASVQSDVYSMASTLYELLCGHAPFFMNADESPAVVRLRALNDPPKPLNIPGMPSQLWDVLNRAMSKDLMDRPESAFQFALDLRAIEVSVGWPETECIIDGVTTMPVPDAERVRTRLTGAVISNGALPNLGELGRTFNLDSGTEDVNVLLDPIQESSSRYFHVDSPKVIVEVISESVPEVVGAAFEKEPELVVNSVESDSLVAFTSIETESSTTQAKPEEQLLSGLFASLKKDEVLASDEHLEVKNLDSPDTQASSEPIRKIEHTEPFPPKIDNSIEAQEAPIEVPENPAAVPGEVLWGHSPRVGLTGTIELNQSGMLPNPASQDSKSEKSIKKPKFGRSRKAKDD